MDIFMAKLPNELQCHIFDLAVCSSESTIHEDDKENEDAATRLINISTVCQTWRKNILSSPLLWSRIDLSNPHFAELSLERAGQSTLDIIFIIDYLLSGLKAAYLWRLDCLDRALGLSSGEREHAIYRVLDLESHRIRNIYFNLDELIFGHTVSAFCPGTRQFPSLLRLTCRIRTKISPWLQARTWDELNRPDSIEFMEEASSKELYAGLRAPLLQELELETILFQRFTFPMTQLTHVKVGPVMYFSRLTFQDLCVWLTELPQLTHLDLSSCKLPSSTIARQALDTHNSTLYFSPLLRHLRLEQTENQFGAALELLQMIPSGHPTDCKVEIDYTLGLRFPGESAESFYRNDAQFCELVHKTIATTSNSDCLSFASIAGDKMNSIELSMWRSNTDSPSPSPSSLPSRIASSSKSEFGRRSIRPWTTSNIHLRAAASPLTNRLFRKLSVSLLTTSRALCIPALRNCSIEHTHSPSGADWEPFLARHRFLEVLAVSQPNCGSLFRALTDALRRELRGEAGEHQVDRTTCIDRLDLHGSQFPAAEKYGLGMASWKALVGYVRMRHQMGRPLMELRFCGCDGITARDADELRGFVSRVVVL